MWSNMLHKSQLILIFSWADSVWSLRLWFLMKILSQESHLKVIPSWIVLMWFFRYWDWVKLLSHESHLKITPSWKDFMWILRLWVCVKLLSHKLQVCVLDRFWIPFILRIFKNNSVRWRMQFQTESQDQNWSLET